MRVDETVDSKKVVWVGWECAYVYDEYIHRIILKYVINYRNRIFGSDIPFNIFFSF